MENLLEQFNVLPGNLANHLTITVIPLAIGAAISLPLAVFVVKHERLRYPTLAAVSVIQTIPSLALLALMVPLFIGISWLTSEVLRLFEVPSLGFYPAVVALTLYSILPMLRNTVTGILGVDPSMTEAARAMGMTPRQVLWKVELPLAFPVIIAGVRTATVWVVGIATLATPVGQRCLGNYIFRGLQTQNWTAVLFGVFAAAILAIGLDLLLGGVEKGANERRRRLTLASAGGLAALVVLGLTAPTAVGAIRAWTTEPAERRAQTATGDEQVEDEDRSAVVVGSKTFTEQYILSTLMTDLLTNAGLKAREKESLGSTIIFNALRDGEIDCYVDYTGTIWANYMDREEAGAAWKVRNQVAGWLASEHNIRMAGTLGFESAYVLAMRREQAERLGIETIADLAEHAPDLKIGGDYEFFGRPDWTKVRDEYGLNFADQISYDSTFMYSAVRQGSVDVIGAFSTDGRIDAFDLKTLDDPRGAFPPYEAILLLSPQASDRRRVAEALTPMLDAIDNELMRAANKRVDVEEQSVGAVADWLRERLTAPVEDGVETGDKTE